MKLRCIGLFSLVILFSACVKCRNVCEHGVCFKRQCECNQWWAGDACDRSVLEPLSGTYAGIARCNETDSAGSFVLNTVVQFPTQFRVSELNTNEDIGYYLEFFERDRFSIKDSNNDGVEYRGEGAVMADGISMRLIQKTALDSIECVWLMSRTN